MASYLDTLTVTADASVQMTLRFCGCITDTADAQVSPFSQVRTNTIVDSAVAAATLTGRRGITMVDSAAASSVLTESAHFVDVLAAGAVAVGDIIAARLTLNLVDTAVAAASLSGQMSLNINDAANAQSTLTAGRRGNDVIVANALARDSLSARRGIVITDAGVATASLAATRRGNDAIVDSANAAASVNATRRLLDSLFGTASANALLSGVLHARDTLVDTAEGEVVLLQPSLKRSAFWTNARTFAGAEWRAVLFNSIAQRDARVFAAGAQGIYELVDDAADGAAPVAAEIVWDLKDFGDNHNKRPEMVYIGAVTAAPLRVRVTTQQGTFTYDTHLTGVTMPTNHRATLGKGLYARYYRFGVTNPNGPFALNTFHVQLHAVARRRG